MTTQTDHLSLLSFAVKTGQKRPINSPAPLSNPHLAQPSNHMSAGGGSQAAPQQQQGGGGAGSGSGPFASALRSLAIKADTKDDEGGANESADGGTSRDSAPTGGGGGARGDYGDRSRDSSNNQPANLSKHSGSGGGGVNSNSRISVPLPQEHHQRAMHHSQTNSTDRSRGGAVESSHLSDERKKKLSPPPEKVNYIGKENPVFFN